MLRRSTGGTPAAAARRPATAAARARAARESDPEDEPVEPLLPPEPDTSELVVRATHVEAPPPIDLDPDDEEPEPEEPEIERDSEFPGFRRGRQALAG